MVDPSLALEVVSTGILAEIARRMGSLRSDVNNLKRRIRGLEDETEPDARRAD